MKRKAAIIMLSLMVALTCTACGGSEKDSSSAESGASVTSGTEQGKQPSADASQEAKTESQNDKETSGNTTDSKAGSAQNSEKKIELSVTSLTMTVGQKFQPVATVSPEDTKSTALVWESTDSSVVTVDKEGMITAVGEGQADITVKSGELGAFCTVTVGASEAEDSEKSDKGSEDSSKTESSQEKKQESKTSPEITGERVDASWFDDAVFIGDSVTAGLYNYADNGCLGDAEFLARECMGFHTAMYGLDDEYGIHPSYRGQKVMLDDGVQMTGKSNVFIMLGMNDICSWGPDESAEAMEEFVDTILAKNPDVNIYIESVTPMIASKHREDFLNNTNIASYNEQAKAICERRGFVFLDIASVVEDGNGNLRDDLCSDPDGLGHHMNSEGMELWVDYLYTHVK